MGHIAHISRFCGVTKPLESAIAGLGAATLRRSLPTRAEQTLATGREAVAPPELPKAGHIISQKPFMPFQPFRNGVAAQVFDAVYGRVSSGVASILRGLHLLLWRGKHFKGCFQPSKWKWYHRHGYWATRKKLLKFDTYRRHRYHEVRGPGKRPPSKWEDQSFYKPLRDSVKFW